MRRTVKLKQAQIQKDGSSLRLSLVGGPHKQDGLKSILTKQIEPTALVIHIKVPKGRSIL